MKAAFEKCSQAEKILLQLEGPINRKELAAEVANLRTEAQNEFNQAIAKLKQQESDLLTRERSIPRQSSESLEKWNAAQQAYDNRVAQIRQGIKDKMISDKQIEFAQVRESLVPKPMPSSGSKAAREFQAELKRNMDEESLELSAIKNERFPYAESIKKQLELAQQPPLSSQNGLEELKLEMQMAKKMQELSKARHQAELNYIKEVKPVVIARHSKLDGLANDYKFKNSGPDLTADDWDTDHITFGATDEDTKVLAFYKNLLQFKSRSAMTTETSSPEEAA
jgi:hypothetical protein